MNTGWYNDENGHRIYVYDGATGDYVHYVGVLRGVSPTSSEWVKRLTPLPDCTGWDWNESQSAIEPGWYVDDAGHRVRIYEVDDDYVHCVCSEPAGKYSITEEIGADWTKNLTPLPDCTGWDSEEEPTYREPNIHQDWGKEIWVTDDQDPGWTKTILRGYDPNREFPWCGGEQFWKYARIKN